MITSGSIRQRRPKVWQITIELPKDPITGKRIRRYRTVEGTKKEAERAMHEFVTELERGIFYRSNVQELYAPKIYNRSTFIKYLKNARLLIKNRAVLPLNYRDHIKE
jgi:hypothetical protein